MFFIKTGNISANISVNLWFFNPRQLIFNDKLILLDNQILHEEN